MTDLQTQLLRAAPFDASSNLSAKLGRNQGTITKAAQRMVKLGLLKAEPSTFGRVRQVQRFDVTLKGIKLRREMRRVAV